MTKVPWSLLVLALLGGCAPPTPAPPTVSPTSTPSAASTAMVASPAATPTTARSAAAATPVSSPQGLSPDQRSRFEGARLLEVEGDYRSAADAWHELTGVAQTAQEARYSLALCLALDGQGAASLETLANGAPDTRDGFVRGLAFEANSQHAQAMQSLADYAAANADVAPAVWLEISEHELNAGRSREAADAAARGLDVAQARPLRQRLLDVRGRALAALGDNDAAFEAHRQVLALATNASALGEQLFRLAQVSRDLGKPDAALQALKTELDQFPQSSTTANALRLLDELGGTDQIDPYVLGRARYYAVDYHNAVAAFERYLHTEPDGPDASNARLYKALASLTPGNEPNALAELDALADDPHQDSDLAAQALLEAGQALEGLAEPNQAELRYQKLLDKFPRLDAAATAGFRLGLDRYVRGADADALAAWESLIARRDDLTADDAARALYWRGKVLSRLGRQADARASFQEAAAIVPSNFYSLRAAALVDVGGAPSTTSAADEEQQLAQWMSARGQDLAAASALVASDPALSRAHAEAAIGLYREANWDADELLQRYPNRTDRLYAFARRFSDFGLVSGATQLGEAAYSAASVQNPRDAPAALLKAAFPRPFAEISDATAARYDIDPLLLDSTLRDASQFDVWAENTATGARGVALISPVHADEAALAVHGNPDDRSRAVSAIQQQAWLLADRLRRFDGRPEVALSAIATTDRLVDSWAVRNGADDPDAYIELVDYEGVRSSLRSLLATRLNYAIAYGTAPARDPLARVSLPPEPTAAWIKISRLGGDVPPDAPISRAATVDSTEQLAAFARGATLQRDGDNVAASAVFSDLASAPDASVQYEARLRLGQSLIARRRPADALEPLSLAASAHPDGPAGFLHGRALADLGRCRDALADFSTFGAAQSRVLAAQALVAQADCLADLGRPGDAVPLLESAAATSDIARLQSLDLRERLALMRLRAGDVDGARADYQALLSSARSPSYQAELNYIQGIIAPDPASAVRDFRTAIQLDSKDRASQAALDELVAIGDSFTNSFEAAETRFAQNRYREALSAYTAFLQQNPTDKRAPQAQYGRGVSLVRLGQDRAGVRVLESISDQFPDTSDAADGLFRAGRIRESLADLDGAAGAYARVIAMPRAGSRSVDSQFRLAFVEFRQGSFSQAAESWRHLASQVTAADERAQAFFWLGKALNASGDGVGARNAWTSATSADPRGFYGLRAADWLSGLGDPLASVTRTMPLVVAHSDDDPAAQLMQWASARDDVAAARDRLAADASLAQAETLLVMGLRQPAIWELGAVQNRFSGSVAALALLGAWEQQHGLYNAALLLGYDLASTAHTSLTSGPPAVRRLVYPLPNPLVLAQAAQQQHVDPLLFASLMLQESLLDQSVESSAQARGLSQLIASTAYDAAGALGMYNFNTTDLYQPRINITLGAFVISERLTRYGNRIFPALAAYNATEFAVDGWLQSDNNSPDIDTFAEAIPFTETYPYVQKIYENYKQYLELYSESNP